MSPLAETPYAQSMVKADNSGNRKILLKLNQWNVKSNYEFSSDIVEEKIYYFIKML